ncbi:MAG: hypothetical protein ABSH06_05420, partial [Thermodesulfobacteriota bacterium]
DSGTMMRYIQKAICGAKTFSDTPIYSQLQNIIFATVEDQSNGIGTALCPRDGLQPSSFIVRRDFEESKGI